MSDAHIINKPNAEEKPMANVEIRCVGGNARQEINSILAKIVLRKIFQRRERQNESSNLQKG
jgi:hypothetical protein